MDMAACMHGAVHASGKATRIFACCFACAAGEWYTGTTTLYPRQLPGHGMANETVDGRPILCMCALVRVGSS